MDVCSRRKIGIDDDDGAGRPIWVRRQIILASEMYESKSSALNGIASVQKNSADIGRFAKLEGKDKAPYFVLKAGNHQVIGKSEMYESEKARDNGIKSVQTNGPGAKTVDLTA